MRDTENIIAYETHIEDMLHVLQERLDEFDEMFDFAKAFYEVELVNRYSWLRELVDKAISKGNLSKATIKALNNAVEVFKRRM